MERIEKCKLAVKLGFTYNGLDGSIITPTGKILSKKTKNGYLMLTLRDNYRKSYYLLAHQFVYWIIHNEIVDCIDHIDRIKTNNIGYNLRSVTKSQNAMNMRERNGYYYSKRDNRFIAYIMVNYKRKQLGSFNTLKEAHECYLENKEKYHIIN